MKKRNGIIFLTCILLASCGKKPEDDLSGEWSNYAIADFIVGYSDISLKNSHHVNPFNTSMAIKYFLNDKNENNDEIKANVEKLYKDKVIELHKIYDRHYYYKDDNNDIITNVKIINDSYGTGNEVHCSDTLYELLKLGITGFELTGGYFNIFTGSLTDFWQDVFYNVYDFEPVTDWDPYYNEDRKELLEKLVEQVPHTIEDVNKQLTFNDENKTVLFNKIGDFDDAYRPYISVGGIAKGLATDKIKETLLNNNYKDGMLISGGSSICSLSKPIFTKDAGGQSLSTRDPNTFSDAAFNFKLQDEFTYSTSGNYTTNESYYLTDENGNVIYENGYMVSRHHIINPFTGYPESFHRSVSLLSYSLSNCYVDILSTAFMNLDIKNGLALRKKLKENYNLDFDLIYLNQEGLDKNYKLEVVSTTNVNNTLKVKDGIKLTYEE